MAKIKIQSDVSDVKKSILGLSKDLKNLGQSKVALFTSEDRKFLKNELKRSLGEMHSQLNRNRTEIEKMLQAQKALVKGSKEETENRLKLLKAYKDQQTLFQKAKATEARGGGMLGGGGGGSGGAIGGLAGSLGGPIGIALGTLVGAAIEKAVSYTAAQAARPGQAYAAGAGNRSAITAMGGMNIGPGQETALARVGLTEDQANERRVLAMRRLGLRAGSASNIMQQAGFERATGIEGGSLLNTATALRANFGGQGADEAQRRLQASIIENGLEEALGPYLESMTGLLDSINENGLSATDDLIRVMGSLQKTSGRTAEQNSRMVGGIDSNIKGSSGESNVFLQQAFARAGIGGGRLGATQEAVASGGLTGLDEASLLKAGINPQAIADMKRKGMIGDSKGGVQARGKAILDQIKASAGTNKSISQITDADTLGAVGGVAARGLGFRTEQEGFLATRALEETLNSKTLTEEEKKQALADFEKGKMPGQAKVDQKLDAVNATLSGLTELSINTNANVTVSAGAAGGAKGFIAGMEGDTSAMRAVGAGARALDVSGASDTAIAAARGVGNLAFGALPGSENLPQAARQSVKQALPDVAEGPLVKVLKNLNNTLNNNYRNAYGGKTPTSVTIVNGDGTLSDKTVRQ